MQPHFPSLAPSPFQPLTGIYDRPAAPVSFPGYKPYWDGPATYPSLSSVHSHEPMIGIYNRPNDFTPAKYVARKDVGLLSWEDRMKVRDIWA